MKIDDAPDLPNIIYSQLSTDQKYLYRICLAIKMSNISKDLSREKPSPINHARWITLAARCCRRLYIAKSKECVSENLKLMVRYVLFVYVTNWFNIRFCSTIVNGSRHFLKMIINLRYMNEFVQQLLQPVLQNGAYTGLIQKTCF